MFDFDGTLGDTELPAMEVAFWELAPYFPDASPASLDDDRMIAYVRANAGKAFEFMVDTLEEERAAAGLGTVEEARAAASEDAAVVAHVNAKRRRFGLPTIEETRALGKDFLTLQKDETVDALSVAAQPCAEVPEVLEMLASIGQPCAIATTSGKPRVPVSVLACGFQEHFPPAKIHSGESDFDPPRFKPDPAVYILAAQSEGAAPENCVAVEDSVSGTGSAANADIGLIVGYVGGSHITREMEENHARSLMAGEKSDNGRGCDIVIREMGDLVRLVAHFKQSVARGDAGLGSDDKPLEFPVKSLLNGMKGAYWVDDARLAE